MFDYFTYVLSQALKGRMRELGVVDVSQNPVNSTKNHQPWLQNFDYHITSCFTPRTCLAFSDKLVDSRYQLSDFHLDVRGSISEVFLVRLLLRQEVGHLPLLRFTVQLLLQFMGAFKNEAVPLYCPEEIYILNIK